MLGRRNQEGNINSNGDRNFNNSGNITLNYYNYSEAKSLNRSLLYDFCVEFSKLEFELEPDYKTITSEIEEKINYNDIKVYKVIFQNSEHYYEDIHDILNEIPNRQKIIQNIHFTYIKFKGFREWKNKDDLCEQVFVELYKKLMNGAMANDIMEEDANLALHSLMYYAFVKCKLLDPVPLIEWEVT